MTASVSVKLQYDWLPGGLSVIDPAWEMIDPIPDIHNLFLSYNVLFFSGELDGIEIKWSKRMTLCAGLCVFDGQLVSVRLSEPLLKLRPRSDLVNTILHEMIHAFIFLKEKNRDHDAHGPTFLYHMKRINQASGSNITVYHNFHDEVDSYRQHWWKCSGPCSKRPPYFGLVKRSMNRPPTANDPWWHQHQTQCGGEFIKIREPNRATKKLKSRSRHKSKANNNTNRHEVNAHKKKKRENHTDTDTTSNNNRNKPLSTIISPIVSTNVQHSKKKQRILNFERHATEGHTSLFSAAGLPSVLGHQISSTNHLIQVNSHQRKKLLNKEKVSQNNDDSTKIITLDSSDDDDNCDQVDFLEVEHQAGHCKHDLPTCTEKSKRILLDNTNQDVLETNSVYSCSFHHNKKSKPPSVVSATFDLVVVCPVCLLTVSSSEINDHLDECLLIQKED